MRYARKEVQKNTNLVSPQMELSCLPEPKLSFAENATHINPKIGIPLYGPKSQNTSRHKSEIHGWFCWRSRGNRKCYEVY